MEEKGLQLAFFAAGIFPALPETKMDPEKGALKDCSLLHLLQTGGFQGPCESAGSQDWEVEKCHIRSLGGLFFFTRPVYTHYTQPWWQAGQSTPSAPLTVLHTDIHIPFCSSAASAIAVCVAQARSASRCGGSSRLSDGATARLLISIAAKCVHMW